MESNNGWFPKEAAPKDGRWFTVYYPNSGMAWQPYEFAAWQQHPDWTYYGIDGNYKSSVDGYFGGTDTSEEIDFEWWQPLPDKFPE